MRSLKNLEYLCDGQSVVYFLRTNGAQVYETVSEIFERKRPLKTTEQPIS